MSYHTYNSQYSPPSHASSLSSSSSATHSNYGSSHLSIAARYEAAKSFDLEDDLEYCPVLTIDEVRLYYDDVTAKSIFLPSTHQHSPPSQSSTPSPPNHHIHPSHYTPRHETASSNFFRPPSRNRGTAAVKIIDPHTREERRQTFY